MKAILLIIIISFLLLFAFTDKADATGGHKPEKPVVEEPAPEEPEPPIVPPPIPTDEEEEPEEEEGDSPSGGGGANDPHKQPDLPDSYWEEIRRANPWLNDDNNSNDDSLFPSGGEGGNQDGDLVSGGEPRLDLGQELRDLQKQLLDAEIELMLLQC